LITLYSSLTGIFSCGCVGGIRSFVVVVPGKGETKALADG
jgi:hypothetical protein